MRLLRHPLCRLLHALHLPQLGEQLGASPSPRSLNAEPKATQMSAPWQRALILLLSVSLPPTLIAELFAPQLLLEHCLELPAAPCGHRRNIAAELSALAALNGDATARYKHDAELSSSCTASDDAQLSLPKSTVILHAELYAACGRGMRCVALRLTLRCGGYGLRVAFRPWSFPLLSQSLLHSCLMIVCCGCTCLGWPGRLSLPATEWLTRASSRSTHPCSSDPSRSLHRRAFSLH